MTLSIALIEQCSNETHKSLIDFVNVPLPGAYQVLIGYIQQLAITIALLDELLTQKYQFQNSEYESL